MRVSQHRKNRLADEFNQPVTQQQITGKHRTDVLVPGNVFMGNNINDAIGQSHARQIN